MTHIDGLDGPCSLSKKDLRKHLYNVKEEIERTSDQTVDNVLAIIADIGSGKIGTIYGVESAIVKI